MILDSGRYFFLSGFFLIVFLVGALAIMQMVAIWLILGFEKSHQVVSELQGRNIRDKGKQSMSIADV